MSSHTRAADFETKLGKLMLLAYASGDVVEGEWHLVNTDAMVPDFIVLVDRISNAGSKFSAHDRITFEPPDTRAFKRELQNFLLEEFAGGGEIEGTWELRYARVDLPAWDVRIVMEDPRTSFNLDRLQNSNG